MGTIPLPVLFLLLLGRKFFSRKSREVGGEEGLNELQFFPQNFQVEINPLYSRELPYTITNYPCVENSSNEERIQEVPHFSINRISRGQKIGEGNFNEVFIGFLKQTGESPPLNIAIKMSRLSDETNLAMEANMLASLHHENIIMMYGMVTEGPTYMLILEHMAHGDLHTYIKERSPQSGGNETIVLADQMKFMCHIASGLKYLDSQWIVHRDISARNCLIGSHLNVKIADFAMSRDILQKGYHRTRKENLPVAWSAPEVLRNGISSSKSDLWSFAVVIWEIFTFGERPWNELSNEELIKQADSPKVLKCPPGCPKGVREIMLKCWAYIPSDRPSIFEVHRRLMQLWFVYIKQRQKETSTGYSEEKRITYI